MWTSPIFANPLLFIEHSFILFAFSIHIHAAGSSAIDSGALVHASNANNGNLITASNASSAIKKSQSQAVWQSMPVVKRWL